MYCSLAVLQRDCIATAICRSFDIWSWRVHPCLHSLAPPPHFNSPFFLLFSLHCLLLSPPIFIHSLLASPFTWISSFYLLLLHLASSPPLLFGPASTSSSFHPSRFQCTALPTGSHASRLVIRHSYNFFSPH